MMICKVLALTIKDLYARMKSSFKQGTFCLTTYRCLHLHLCDAVEKADSFVSPLIFNMFATNIPLLCALLYNVIRYIDYMSPAALAVQFVWVVISIGTLTTVCVYGTLVHKEVGVRSNLPSRPNYFVLVTLVAIFCEIVCE